MIKDYYKNNMNTNINNNKSELNKYIKEDYELEFEKDEIDNDIQIYTLISTNYTTLINEIDSKIGTLNSNENTAQIQNLCNDEFNKLILISEKIKNIINNKIYDNTENKIYYHLENDDIIKYELYDDIRLYHKIISFLKIYIDNIADILILYFKENKIIVSSNYNNNHTTTLKDILKEYINKQKYLERNIKIIYSSTKFTRDDARKNVNTIDLYNIIINIFLKDYYINDLNDYFNKKDFKFKKKIEEIYDNIKEYNEIKPFFEEYIENIKNLSFKINNLLNKIHKEILIIDNKPKIDLYFKLIYKQGKRIKNIHSEIINQKIIIKDKYIKILPYTDSMFLYIIYLILIIDYLNFFYE
jgi:hypothetical protein